MGQNGRIWAHLAVFGLNTAHLASILPYLASILPILGQYSQYGPILGQYCQYWANTANTGQYPYPYPCPCHTPIPIPHTPYPYRVPHPPYHGPVLPLPLPHPVSRWPEPVHQASFVLNTKCQVYIPVAIFIIMCKSDKIRGSFCLDFSKMAVFRLFLPFCPIFSHIWQYLAKHRVQPRVGLGLGYTNVSKSPKY